MNDMYQQFVLRNKGYIDSQCQDDIYNTRLVIAGCGLGSSIAEAMLRIGFVNIVLVDGDTVSIHNLNRQNFLMDDVNDFKVLALQRRLKSIFPQANVIAINEMIDHKNVKQIISMGDIIIDTIDFLDMAAIDQVHLEAAKQNKSVITAASAGWGSLAYFFPPSYPNTGLREVLGIKHSGELQEKTYAEFLNPFFARMHAKFDEEILIAMEKTMKIMEDGTPCPAPHLSVGASSVAALCTTLLVNVVKDQSQVLHGEMIINNFKTICKK